MERSAMWQCHCQRCVVYASEIVWQAWTEHIVSGSAWFWRSDQSRAQVKTGQKVIRSTSSGVG